MGSHLPLSVHISQYISCHVVRSVPNETSPNANRAVIYLHRNMFDALDILPGSWTPLITGHCTNTGELFYTPQAAGVAQVLPYIPGTYDEFAVDGLLQPYHMRERGDEDPAVLPCSAYSVGLDCHVGVSPYVLSLMLASTHAAYQHISDLNKEKQPSHARVLCESRLFFSSNTFITPPKDLPRSLLRINSQHILCKSLSYSIKGRELHAVGPDASPSSSVPPPTEVPQSTQSSGPLKHTIAMQLSLPQLSSLKYVVTNTLVCEEFHLSSLSDSPTELQSFSGSWWAVTHGATPQGYFPLEFDHIQIPTHVVPCDTALPLDAIHSSSFLSIDDPNVKKAITQRSAASLSSEDEGFSTQTQMISLLNMIHAKIISNIIVISPALIVNMIRTHHPVIVLTQQLRLSHAVTPRLTYPQITQIYQLILHNVAMKWTSMVIKSVIAYDDDIYTLIHSILAKTLPIVLPNRRSSSSIDQPIEKSFRDTDSHANIINTSSQHQQQQYQHPRHISAAHPINTHRFIVASITGREGTGKSFIANALSATASLVGTTHVIDCATEGLEGMKHKIQSVIRTAQDNCMTTLPIPVSPALFSHVFRDTTDTQPDPASKEMPCEMQQERQPSISPQTILPVPFYNPLLQVVVFENVDILTQEPSTQLHRIQMKNEIIDWLTYQFTPSPSTSAPTIEDDDIISSIYSSDHERSGDRYSPFTSTNNTTNHQKPACNDQEQDENNNLLYLRPHILIIFTARSERHFPPQLLPCIDFELRLDYLSRHQRYLLLSHYLRRVNIAYTPQMAPSEMSPSSLRQPPRDQCESEGDNSICQGCHKMILTDNSHTSHLPRKADVIRLWSDPLHGSTPADIGHMASYVVIQAFTSHRMQSKRTNYTQATGSNLDNQPQSSSMSSQPHTATFYQSSICISDQEWHNVLKITNNYNAIPNYRMLGLLLLTRSQQQQMKQQQQQTNQQNTPSTFQHNHVEVEPSHNTPPDRQPMLIKPIHHVFHPAFLNVGGCIGPLLTFHAQYHPMLLHPSTQYHDTVTAYKVPRVFPTSSPHTRTSPVSPAPGILISGDSGTGKTFLAELFALSMHYKIVRGDVASLTSKYVGGTAKAIRELFYQAYVNRPCVLLFENIDTFSIRRQPPISLTNVAQTTQFHGISSSHDGNVSDDKDKDASDNELELSDNEGEYEDEQEEDQHDGFHHSPQGGTPFKSTNNHNHTDMDTDSHHIDYFAHLSTKEMQRSQPLPPILACIASEMDRLSLSTQTPLSSSPTSLTGVMQSLKYPHPNSTSTPHNENRRNPGFPSDNAGDADDNGSDTMNNHHVVVIATCRDKAAIPLSLLATHRFALHIHSSTPSKLQLCQIFATMMESKPFISLPNYFEKYYPNNKFDNDHRKNYNTSSIEETVAKSPDFCHKDTFTNDDINSLFPSYQHITLFVAHAISGGSRGSSSGGGMGAHRNPPQAQANASTIRLLCDTISTQALRSYYDQMHGNNNSNNSNSHHNILNSHDASQSSSLEGRRGSNTLNDLSDDVSIYPHHVVRSMVSVCSYPLHHILTDIQSVDKGLRNLEGILQRELDHASQNDDFNHGGIPNGALTTAPPWKFGFPQILEDMEFNMSVSTDTS